MIAENELEKRKRLNQQEETKKYDAKLIQEEMKAREQAEKAREQKIKDRDDKI